MDSQAGNTIFSTLNRETQVGKEKHQRPKVAVEGYKMRMDTCSDSTPPLACLVLCRGLNPQLQQLWLGSGGTAGHICLVPVPWCPVPSRTRHPGVLLSLGWDWVIPPAAVGHLRTVTMNWWQFRAPRGADYANEDIRFNGIPRFLVTFNYLPSSPSLRLSPIKLKQTTPSRLFVTGVVLVTN